MKLARFRVRQPGEAIGPYTRAKTGNATLRVIYKVSSPNAGSGIFIGIPKKPKSEDDAINKGIEVQIDGTGDEWHCTGVLYPMTRAKAAAGMLHDVYSSLSIPTENSKTPVLRKTGSFSSILLAAPLLRLLQRVTYISAGPGFGATDLGGCCTPYTSPALGALAMGPPAFRLTCG